MSNISVGILILLSALMVFGSRRWALVAMMAGVLFASYGQGLDVLGLNLYSIRILATVGFLRVLFRGEFSVSDMNDLDRAFFIAYIYMTAIFLLRTSLGGQTSDAVTQISTLGKVGALVDSLLCYVAFRGLIRGTSDIAAVLRRLAFLLVPFVGLVYVERLTGTNPFASIGAISDLSVWSDGRVRCVGSFRHPSLLGTMGASFLPLYLSLALSKGHRAFGVAGVVLSLAVVVLSGSSGPIVFSAIVFVSWCLWAARRNMAMVRRWIASSVIVLWVAMYIRNGDHIWWLPAIISHKILGGGGWHRSSLIDVAYRHLGEWWLVGMPLDLTRDWFPYLVGGAADITNYYLLIGLDSGIIGIVLFVVLLIRGFRFVGLARASITECSTTPRLDEALIWGLGVALVGHVANWFAIMYFDQTNVIWCMQIAAISGLYYTFAEADQGRAPTRQAIGTSNWARRRYPK